MDDDRNGVSDDLAALRAIVHIPVEARSGRWEVFETPEYKGGVPGPTDYITLVVELETGDKPLEAVRRNSDASVAIVPEAARPWLSTDFRNLLSEGIESQLTLSAKNACEPYQSMMTKSGRPANGFICIWPGRTLIYLTLESN